jgi:hypothetical protein
MSAACAASIQLRGIVSASLTSSYVRILFLIAITGTMSKTNCCYEKTRSLAARCLFSPNSPRAKRFDTRKSCRIMVVKYGAWLLAKPLMDRGRAGGSRHPLNDRQQHGFDGNGYRLCGCKRRLNRRSGCPIQCLESGPLEKSGTGEQPSARLQQQRRTCIRWSMPRLEWWPTRLTKEFTRLLGRRKLNNTARQTGAGKGPQIRFEDRRDGRGSAYPNLSDSHRFVSFLAVPRIERVGT